MTKYECVIQRLKESMDNGTYREGDRLPTENELAAQFGVSRHTVRQALGKLEYENRIESIRGSGTFVRRRQPAQNATMRVAVIIRYIDDYIYPAILKGIQRELAKKNYTMLLYATDNHVDRERKNLTDCLEQQVDGILVEATKSARPNPNTDIYRRLQQQGMPLVFMDTFYDGIEPPVCVGMDDYHGTQQLTRYLQEKGRQRIAAFFKEDTKAGHTRYKAYIEEEIAAGKGIEDDAVNWYNTENADTVVSDAVIDKLRRYDAVICYNDVLACELVKKSLASGIRVPEDLAVVSFDNSVQSEASPVKITSMEHPKERMGELAAQKLINLINGSPEKSIQMRWTLVEKKSS